MDQYKTTAGYPFLYRIAYLLALALIVLPLSDITLGIIPLQLESMRWRVGATGLLTGASLLPLCGLFLAIAVSHIRQHRFAQYLFAAVAGLGAVCLTIVLAFFILDTLQLRNDVNPQRIQLYDRATIKGVLSQVLLVVSLIWLCVGGLRASFAARRTDRLRRKNQDAVVMARTGDARQPASTLAD